MYKMYKMYNTIRYKINRYWSDIANKNPQLQYMDSEIPTVWTRICYQLNNKW